MEGWFALAGAYLLGSVPVGWILGRWRGGLDLGARGSGNIGATNVARLLGWRWGLVTLVLDAAKGAAAVGYVGPLWGGDPVQGGALAAVAAVIGHQHSVWRRFRGGKGVATALGGFLVLSPGPSIACLGIFAGVLWRWGYVSAGSLAGAAALPLFMLLGGNPGGMVGCGAVVCGLIWLRHAGNIRRLWRGEEPRFGGGAGKRGLR